MSDPVASLVRAMLIGGGASLPFIFNPTEFSISRTAQWSTTRSTSTGSAGGAGGAGAAGSSASAGAAASGGRGLSAAGPTAKAHTPQSFRGSQPGTLTIPKLFLADPFAMPGWLDISPMLAILQSWTEIPLGSPDNQPALLTFIWGRPVFSGYMKSCTITYKRFREDGAPVWAEVNVQLSEEPNGAAGKGQNPTSRGPGGRRSHTMSEGDSLQSVAHGEYGNPNLWRPLAESNGIDDPLRARSGTRLMLPSRSDVAPAATV